MSDTRISTQQLLQVIGQKQVQIELLEATLMQLQQENTTLREAMRNNLPSTARKRTRVRKDNVVEGEN